MPKIYSSRILEDLSEEYQKRILFDLASLGAAETARRHYEDLGIKETNLYKTLSNEAKKQRINRVVGFDKQDDKLKEDEKLLLIKYERGEVGFDEMQRVLATKMFKRLLTGEDKVTASDWLRSEQIKIRKMEVEDQKTAMEEFLDAMFSGFLPSLTCPYCGESTIVKRELLGDKSRVMVADTENTA